MHQPVKVTFMLPIYCRRSGWVKYNTVISTNAARDGKDVCTKCGSGILSSPRDPDESPTAPPGSLTAATSASCYIQTGEGLTRDMFDQRLTWRAIRPCPANSYGAADAVFGLAEVACTQCGFGLGAPAGSSKAEQCKNRGGYGYR
jgi:DNA-directed RNA polymerase subunit RPC12/RpoP